MAADVLISRNVPEERILFLNLIASPEGVATFAKRFPKLRVVTAFVDQGLDEKKYDLLVIFVAMSLMSIEVILSQASEILVTASILFEYRRRPEQQSNLALHHWVLYACCTDSWKY